MQHTMNSGLQDLLSILRSRRGFNAAACLNAKANLINSYFRDNGLNAAVFGLSGGVDSAVVAAVLAHAMHQPDSPIKRVVALIVPIDAIGSSGQDAAATRAKEVVEVLGIESWTCDMSTPQVMARQVLQDASGVWMSQWSCGQMLSIMRTPLFYGAAAVLQQEGFRSLVVGKYKPKSPGQCIFRFLDHRGRYVSGIVWCAQLQNMQDFIDYGSTLA